MSRVFAQKGKSLYMSINLEELKKAADGAEILYENIPDAYLSDTLGRLKGTADAVVKPHSTEQVSSILKWAYAHEIPVTPRGAGTNLVGSTVPDHGGIVLDLSEMNRVLELDEETFTATVEPGIRLCDFQQYVEERGYFYPPDPGEKTATIGGNISTNAGGMRAVKYGVTRDYVMGLEIVLSDGRVLTVGSKNIKDSSGLSLKNILIGSEGTLAVITKCILKLLPKPETSLSAVIPFASLGDGIKSVLTIIRENVNPTAIEFVERKVVKLGEDFLSLSFPCPQAKAYLIVTFDGRKEEVETSLSRVREAVLKEKALDVITLDNKKLSEEVWKIRGVLVKAVEAVSEQEPVDIVVPINKMVSFIEYVHQVEEETGMQMVSFGHAGDGNVHLCVVRGDRDEETWQKERTANMKRIYGKAYELGGLTSGEHGIGLTKKQYFLAETPSVNLELMRGIKESFDKKHILNSHISYNIG